MNLLNRIMKFHKTKMLFPEGKIKALTMSYDDGVTQDKRLIQIFNRHGIKGTFNLNSGSFGQQDEKIIKGVRVNHSHIPIKEIKEVYANHEVAIHTLTHANLGELPKDTVIYEIIEDKKNLEELVGYPVRGMAYPFGSYNNDVLDALKQLNIEYSRTVKIHEKFHLPNDFIEWETTCHHGNKEIFNLAKKFVESNELSLFYIWGHSYEFDINDNWKFIEKFCEVIGNNDKIWYATNIEIVDYVNAVKSLKFSTTGSSVYNPSGQDVWISINSNPYKISKGRIEKIDIVSL
ncbi:polysaccharide deacetylase family protein [Clostridium sp. SHJSY1]|uniref:polysaccharide deacetylase family protein n=1 Tax=Clostridium sp. SHJSY1 TaxID=2942483 RepID=UPI00287B743F|nr:polysaccharide deacetylase family protein [Clostridium sp. SHJSY1]